MSVIITATLPDGSTSTMEVDAIISENDQHSATITEHPVEEGSNVSDNIRPNAEVLHLELLFTNSPLIKDPLLPDAAAATIAEQSHDLLIEWQAAGALLSVPLTLGLRDSMAIESIGTTRTAKDGGQKGKTGGLKIPLGLKYIRIIQNAQTTVSVSKDPRVPKVKDLGAGTDLDEVDTDAAKAAEGKAAIAFIQKGLPQ